MRGVLLCEREHRGTRLPSGALHHREQSDGARRGQSTVHKDLSERLPSFNRPLYLQVKGVLEENKAERHIRGGIATRRKYKGI